MPSGFIFLKSQKTHAHVHCVSAHVRDHTCNKSQCLPLSESARPLHMTKEDHWNGLWPQHMGWAGPGDPREWGGSCGVTHEGQGRVSVMSSFAGSLTYRRGEEKDTTLYFSGIQSIIFQRLNDGEWIAYGIILVGQLDFRTASYNSHSSSKISGAEAVFFALPVLCLRQQRP